MRTGTFAARRIAGRYLFPALTALVLAGCTLPSPFKPAPEPVVPPQYKNVAPEAENNLTRQWWRLYGDPRLSELVETTLQNNPYTEIGLMRVAQARAQVRATAADGELQVKTDAYAMNMHSSTTTPLGRLLGGRSISGNEFGVRLGASWQWDLWNRVANAVKAAEARVAMAEIFARNVELVLATEVVVTYWQFRGAEAELAVLAKARARRTETVSLLEKRVQADLDDARALANERVELGKVESDMAEARKKRSLAEQELATLVVKPLKEFSMPSDAAYRLPEIPGVTPGLPSVILARRPDLAESTQTIQELVAYQAIAEAAFYPSIGLTGIFGFASQDLRDVLKSDSRQFLIGPLMVSLPIFDGGRNQANLEIARARYYEAVNMHYSKLLIALREVDDALTEIKTSRDQMDIRGETLRAANQRVSVARSRYEAGVANFIEVTKFDSEALEVERALTRSRIDGLLATVRLVAALGGGWGPDR